MEDTLGELWETEEGLSDEEYQVVIGEDIEGSEGSETLEGGEGNDWLWANGGDDTLTGLDGDDWLLGGEGNDTFIFNTGDGHDTVVDAEGENTLVINGTAVEHLQAVMGESDVYQWVNADGEILDEETLFIANGDQLQILVGGANSGDSITVRDFHFDNNHFGLSFSEPEAPEMPEMPGNTDGMFVWNPEEITDITETGSEWLAFRLWARLYPGLLEGPFHGRAIYYDADHFAGRITFEGSEYNDILIGAEGRRSFLYGNAGDDYIRDDGYVEVEPNMLNVFAGGSGSDTIIGGEGTDYLFGGHDSLSIGDTPSTSSDWPTVNNFGQWYSNLMTANLYDVEGDENTIYGGGGNDFISGDHYTDYLFGGDGNDRILGQRGDDIISGESGNDLIFGDSRFRDFHNTVENLIYYYSSFVSTDSGQHTHDDILSGGEGNDHIFGELGNDTISGGEGNDTLMGDRSYRQNLSSLLTDGYDDTSQEAFQLAGELHGDDVLDGGAGNDYLYGNGGNDTLSGGEGNDWVIGDDHAIDLQYHGNDSLYGGAGDDVLIGGAGDDLIEGGEGNDSLYGDGHFYETEEGVRVEVGDNPADYGTGNDRLFGGAGEDQISGGAGDDYLSGDEGDDVLLGGGGSDVLRGGLGNDFVQDALDASSSDINRLFGEGGDDTLLSAQGADILDGGEGSDMLFSQDGNDTLLGGSGELDYLIAGNGDDVLIGGAGTDYMFGQAGSDTYRFERGHGYDSVVDNGQNRFEFSHINASNVRVYSASLALGADAATAPVTLSFGGGDAVTFSRAAFSGGTFVFANGTVTADDLWSFALEQYQALNANLYGYTSNGVSGNEVGGGSSVSVSQAQSLNGLFQSDSTGNESLGSVTSDGTTLDSTTSDSTASEPRYYLLWFSGQLLAIDQAVANDEASDVNPADPLTWLQNGAVAVTGPVTYFENADGELMAGVPDGSGGFLPPAGAVTEYTLLPDGAGLLTAAPNFNGDTPPTVTPDGVDSVTDGAEGDTSGVAAENDILSGTDADDTLDSAEGNDVILGQAGHDQLNGGTGDDILMGGVGNDTLMGNDDNDRLFGEVGDDNLQGDRGEDYLDGGAGDDTLEGGAGEDTLVGGEGNDTLDGGLGHDTYRISLNEGVDEIIDRSTYNSEINNTLLFDSSIEEGQVRVIRDGNTARFEVISLSEYDEEGEEIPGGEVVNQVIVQNYFSSGQEPVVTVRFEGSGTVWGQEAVRARSLIGAEADEHLVGFDSDDVLIGNAGNDTLEGGRGADEYRIALGDGDDVIIDNTLDANRVVLGEGIREDNTTVTRVGDDAILTISGLIDGEAIQQVVTLQNYFRSVSTAMALIQFTESDTEWDLDAMRAQSLVGTDGDDELEGYDSDDTIIGGAGNDRLTDYEGTNRLDGGAGDDTLRGSGQLLGGQGDDSLVGTGRLEGGEGDDYLTGQENGIGRNLLIGGLGDDVLQGNARTVEEFHFARGDGHDVIIDNGSTENILVFGEGIAESSLLVRRSGDDALLHFIDDSQDSITLRNFFVGSPTVGTVQFSDSTQWNAEHMRALALIGTEEDEVLEGYDSDDTLIGQGGNDVLTGGAGSDTYLFAAGDGDDRIITGETDVDTLEVIRFDDSVNEADVSLVREGEDLVIHYADDAVTVEDFFVSDGYSTHAIDAIEFASGVSWSQGDIKAMLLVGDESDNTLNGFRDDDEIIGNGGDDTLYGNRGDDTLYGGSGNDTLDGGLGNDTMDGGEGSDTFTDQFGYNTFFGGNGNDTITGMGQLFGEAGNDTLTGTGVLSGGEGNDVLTGQGLKDELRGGAGDDILYADDSEGPEYFDDEDVGVQILNGGTGNDTLYGSFQGDVYQFSRGDGQDTIIETQLDGRRHPSTPEEDILQFGEGISADDVAFTRQDLDLVITINGTDDQITIKDWFYPYNNNRVLMKIERFLFADGTELVSSEVDSLAVYVGTDADDQLQGYLDVSDTILGGDGNDQIYGDNTLPSSEGGDDLLMGQNGDDFISGYGGDDTLRGGQGNDQLFGGEGMDLLEGGIGDDYLAGGLGNDHLVGGAGNDTFDYGEQGGLDTIDVSGGGNDVLIMNEISFDRLGFYQDGDDLVVRVDRDSEQEVRVLNHFLGGDQSLSSVAVYNGDSVPHNQIPMYVIEPQVRPYSEADDDTGGGDTGGGDTGNPGDGDSGNGDPGDTDPGTGNPDTGAPGGISVDPDDYDTQINASGPQTEGTNANDYINGWDQNENLFGHGGDDYLAGNDGNDYLSGGNGFHVGSGNDVLFGGAGNDVLVGEDGNDWLEGGVGNDHYYYYANNGQDVISETDGTQDVLFFNDVSIDRLNWYRQGDNLIVRVDDDTQQQVTVMNHFLGGSYAIEAVAPYVEGEVSILIPANQFESFVVELPEETLESSDSIAMNNRMDVLISAMASFDNGSESEVGGVNHQDVHIPSVTRQLNTPFDRSVMM
nr:calcium-binding protein [Marinibactrum halimedae]